MGSSLLLAALILALALFCAWAVTHFGKKAGQPRARLRMISIAFVLGGILFAAFAFWTDSGQRQVTLLEVVLPGSEEGSVPVRRGASFAFEHPGVEHRLIVLPKPAFGRDATRPVSATVLLRTDDGETVLSVRVSFGLRGEATRHGPARTVWEDRTWRFVPTRAVPATIEITLETPGVHEILVRIEDPEKRDGERAPGY